MKRVFLTILVNIIMVCGVQASNVVVPTDEKLVGQDSWMEPAQALMGSNPEFFKNPDKQSVQACCDVLIDFLDVFYSHHEELFVPLFKDLHIPSALLTRTVKIYGGNVSQQFDMRQPAIVKTQLPKFCETHNVQPCQLIDELIRVIGQIGITNLLKDQFLKGPIDLLSTQGEREDIQKAVAAVEGILDSATGVLERNLYKAIQDRHPSLFFEESQDSEEELPQLVFYYLCGFEDFINTAAVSEQIGVDWTRYCLLFKYMSSVQTVVLVANRYKEYSKRIELSKFIDHTSALVANKFKPIQRVNSFGELGDLEPASPVMDMLMFEPDLRNMVEKVSWTNWTRTFFESFETVSIDEALEYLMIAADMVATSKQQFFEMFLSKLGTTNIIHNLTLRDICVTFYKGEKLDLYSASRIGQKALNALATKHLKERNVDIYDLLPFMRGFLLEKSVWDYMCKSFDEGWSEYQGAGSKVNVVLKAWRRLEEKEEKAYKNLEKLIDATHSVNSTPWKRAIAIPAGREKKSFTSITMSCRNAFDNPLNPKAHDWRSMEAGDTPEKWTLLVAKFLHFRAATTCLFAKELSGAFQGGRRKAVTVQTVAAPDKRLEAKREQLQRKATPIPMTEPVDDEGKRLAVNIHKGDKGLIVQAVTSAIPAAVVTEAQETTSRPAEVTAVNQALEDPRPPEVFREKPAAPQPAVEPDSYYVGDLPMIEDVILSWPKGKDRQTQEQESRALIEHVVKLLNHYAKSRQAQARALFVAVGKDYNVQDTDFIVNIWETKQAARHLKAMDAVLLHIDFMAKASSLHEKLTEWTHANPDRIQLLWFLRQDLVSKIYLLQVSARLARHVKGLESVPQAYFHKDATTLQMSEGLLASKALFKDVWSCYKETLKGFLSHQTIRPGLLIHDDYLEQVEMTMTIPGLDPIGPENQEVVAGFEHFLGLRDYVLRAICSPEFKAYFDEQREMRMLTFPDQDIAPICIPYLAAKAMQDARTAELQKVKAVTKVAIEKRLEAEKKLAVVQRELAAANDIEKGYQQLLTNQAEQRALDFGVLQSEVEALKKQLEEERAAKRTLQDQTKEMKRAHEEAKKTANAATKEKLAEAAAVLEETKRALSQASRTNKLRRIIDSKSRVQARLTQAAFADMRAVHKALEAQHGKTRKELNSAYQQADERYHQLCSAKYEQEKAQLQLARFIEEKKSEVDEREKAQAIIREQNAVQEEKIKMLGQEVESTRAILAQSLQEAELLKQDQAAARKNHEEVVRKLEQDLEKAGQEISSLQQNLQAAKDEAAHWIEQNNDHFGKVQELMAQNKALWEDVEIVKKQCDELWYAKRDAEKELEALKQKPAEAVQVNNPELETKVQKLKAKLAAAQDTIASLNMTIGLLQKGMK